MNAILQMLPNAASNFSVMIVETGRCLAVNGAQIPLRGHMVIEADMSVTTLACTLGFFHQFVLLKCYIYY